MKKIYLILILNLFLTQIYAQNPVKATKAAKRLTSTNKVLDLRSQSLISDLKFNNIGPGVMSGRVVDIDADPNNPEHFYVAFASGGLWVTYNNGQSFSPLFQDQNVITIGDIAVDWAHGEKIWLGTGENNSSRSSYSGTGIYLSTDKGKTWQLKGLAETQHIGRIVLNPKDENTVFVAAIGHLYSPNEKRGVYITHDGGNTWKQSLKINPNTGAIDLVVDNQNPAIIYAAMWHRERRAWNFTEAGDGSGIYKSIDAGNSWVKLNTKESGFPYNEKVGRIGLTISNYNGQKTLYAIVDNQNFRPQIQKKDEDLIKKEDFSNMSEKKFLKLDDQKLKTFLRNNNFPKEYTVAKIKEMVKNKTIQPIDLKYYLEDENKMLFDTPIIGAEVYRSDDEGKTWIRTHADYLDDVFYTYGYYFGQIRVNPQNAENFYILGVPILSSTDGGKSFKSINPENVHPDHHALWINPKNPKHMIDGNDGGINITYDAGKTWINANSIPVGQFYSVTTDNAEPYHVYGGLQDNGVWVGPSDYKASNEWHQTGHYPYKMVLGGDGMQVAVDTRDNTTIYTGYQFGYYYRVDKNTGQMKSIKPKHKLGEHPYRFNWQAPIWLSKHNQDVVYFGSNHFHRSLNKGNDMETLSGDLTNGGKKGDVSYGTLTSIHESPLRFGLIYVGSDDGLVHVSKDGGYNWKNISKGLPANLWVSRVWASAHKLSRVYVALNGYRWDNFNPYVYVSDDFGKTWKNISSNLPQEPINVIKEDPVNENLLFVGTDNGLYITLNKGESWNVAGTSLPRVAVHDLTIQEREHDLIVATHGRSLYKTDIKSLEKLNSSVLDKKLFVFDLNNKRYNSYWAKSWSKWMPLHEPQYNFSYYSQKKGIAQITIFDENNTRLATFKDTAVSGLNFASYNLTIDQSAKVNYEKTLNKNSKTTIKLEKADNEKYYIRPGKYTLELKLNGKTEKKDFEVTE